jgi:predicted component of type VI protein secretion system
VFVLLTGTTAKGDNPSPDVMRQMQVAPDRFYYEIVSNYGSMNTYGGEWNDTTLNCKLYLSHKEPEQFVVDLNTLISTREDGLRYDLRTHEILN